MFVEDFVETEEPFGYSLIFSTTNLSIVLLECHEKVSSLQYFDTEHIPVVYLGSHRVKN